MQSRSGKKGLFSRKGVGSVGLVCLGPVALPKISIRLGRGRVGEGEGEAGEERRRSWWR